MADAFRYPEGVYQVEIVSTGFRQAATKSGPKFVFLADITPLARKTSEGVYQEVEARGRKLEAFVEDAVYDQFLDWLRDEKGIDVDDVGRLDAGAENPIDLQGVVLEAVCKHRTGEGKSAGKTYESWYLPGNRKIEPLAKEHLDALRAMKNYRRRQDGKSVPKGTFPWQRQQVASAPAAADVATVQSAQEKMSSPAAQPQSPQPKTPAQIALERCKEFAARKQ